MYRGEHMKKELIKRGILDTVLMIVLAIVFAFNYMLFVVKNQFAPAGFNGIATMIEYKTGFSVGYFSLIINVPLCLFAFFFIDRGFAAKTFVFSVVYSVCLLILQTESVLSVISRFQYDAQGVDTIFPALIAGAVGGYVYGVSFRRNASTGGADVVAKFVSKKNPMLNFFWINFAINAVIALVSYFVYAEPDGAGGFLYEYKPVCLCMLYCFLSSMVGNSIIKGSKSAYKFLIITTHTDEIEREIFLKLKHSATKIAAEGAYSRSHLDVLLCVVNKRQLIEFRDILAKYDNTFSFVETVNEIYGNFVNVKNEDNWVKKTLEKAEKVILPQKGEGKPSSEQPAAGQPKE